MSACEERCIHGVRCQGDHEEPGEHWEWADCHCCGNRRAELHIWGANRSCDGGDE